MLDGLAMVFGVGILVVLFVLACQVVAFAISHRRAVHRVSRMLRPELPTAVARRSR